MAAGIQLPPDNSIAGFNKLQKLAATITPPVKPRATSSTVLFNDLNKKTNDAPKAVTNHVKVVATNAATIGSILLNHSTKSFHIIVILVAKLIKLDVPNKYCYYKLLINFGRCYLLQKRII